MVVGGRDGARGCQGHVRRGMGAANLDPVTRILDARVEREIGILQVARDEPGSLERAADAFCDHVHEALKLGWTRRRHGRELKAWTDVAIDSVEKQHVEVDIQVECRAETLDQRDGARRQAWASQARFAD